MDRIEAIFGDQTMLAERLLIALGDGGTDGSHDRSHLLRVARNAMEIAATEPECDRAVVTAAVLLHDCVEVEKNSPAALAGVAAVGGSGTGDPGRVGMGRGTHRTGRACHRGA